MTQEAFQWVLRPSKRLLVPIISIKVGQPLLCHPVGPALGAPAHFLDGGSSPCSALLGAECQLCKIQPARWKGFLPVQTRSGARRIVEVTEACAERNPSLCEHSAKSSWWEFFRRGPNKNSPLMAVRQPQYEPLADVKWFDPMMSVLYMWRLIDKPVPNMEDAGQG